MLRRDSSTSVPFLQFVVLQQNCVQGFPHSGPHVIWQSSFDMDHEPQMHDQAVVLTPGHVFGGGGGAET